MPAPNPVRRWLPSRALLTALLLTAACLALPTLAPAAPLNEVEQNDSSLSANGPLPADGFQSTLNVNDDVDYFIFRLQGRRQVDLTFALLGGCGTPGRLLVTDADGNQIATAGVGGGTQTRTWTTPRDATEYVARVIGFSTSTGCQYLTKIGPADALITGPLPAPAYIRTLSVAAPAQVGLETSVPITATGSAADEDRVAALWTTGGCPAAPVLDASGIVLGNTLASGPYSVTLPTTSPGTVGPATLCTWLYDTLGKLEPLLRQQTVTIVGPPVDHDDDGIVAGPDCDDSDANIKPGAPEIRGNKVDENCDGHSDPYPRAPAIVSLSARRLRGGDTQINALVIRQVSRSFEVRVRCRGFGCRSALDDTFRAPRGKRTLSLTRLVRGMRLAPGAKLTLRVSRSGYQVRVQVPRSVCRAFRLRGVVMERAAAAGGRGADRA